MRNFIIFGLLLLVTGCGERNVPPTQLPQEIQTFVKQYFPTQTITYAEKELEWFTYKYDVILADGTQINFDTDNVWDKIDAKMATVPAALIPTPIATYVNTQFPAVAITKIDKERYGYDVDLANDLELKFNEQGALMEMDD